MQLDIFHNTTANSTSIVGLTAVLPRPCGCGSCEVTIGASSGPHFGSYICTNCHRHRAWMSGVVHAFISGIIEPTGKRPEEPIQVKFTNSRSMSVDDHPTTATEI
jgi:hypothetical protein